MRAVFLMGKMVIKTMGIFVVHEFETNSVGSGSGMATTCYNLKETSTIFIQSGNQHGQASGAMACVADAGLSLPGQLMEVCSSPGLLWSHNSSTDSTGSSTKNGHCAPGISRR